MSCHNKRCIQSKCRNNAMCNKIGGINQYNCVKGKCVKIESCSTRQQCRTKYGRHYACVKNICRKIRTGCRGDDDCPKGRKIAGLKWKLCLAVF